ncbi:hypothetical protein A9Q81_03615 [Gammaproteobacteria bacterium 42_54_T18]|nr:hypothetical protein A9Q81_03615 [Gammaproteobacteria bacterium 42_54_T18]
MYDHQEIRELLIDTCHSNDLAVQFFEEKLGDKELLELLVRIAIDEEDYGGDAPMAAGDYIFKYPVEWLEKYEESFVDILKREHSAVRPENIAMALAKIKSPAAKTLIEREIKALEYGPRCEKIKIALELYNEQKSK